MLKTENKIASKDDENFRTEFYDWIYSKYNNLSNDISWLGLIKQISQNESKEFDLFFELLKDFNKDKELFKKNKSCVFACFPVVVHNAKKCLNELMNWINFEE